MANLDGLVVRRLVEEDRPRWIEAFEDVFEAPLGGVRSAPHFDWSYLQLPEGKLWGMVAVPEDQAEPGGPIAASYSMIPRRFWINGQERMGALSLDTLTTLEWRKRGLFIHLAQEAYRRAAEEGLDFVYGFPNPNSTHGFVTHLGWELLPSPPVLMSVRPLAWVAGWLRSGDAEGRRGSVRARQISEVDDRFDSLWARTRDRAEGWAVRDAAFYRWRTARPDANYSLWTAEHDDGTLLATCLMAQLDRPEGVRGYLLDLLAPPEEDATLIWLVKHAAAHLAAKHHVKLVQSAVSENPFGSTLRSAGFRPVPNRLHSEVKLGWAPQSEAMRNPGIRADRWSVGYIDADTV